VSQTAAYLILVIAMLVTAVYLLIAPPPGLGEGFYRILLPWVFIALALIFFENVRTRAHISQLVGVMRMLAGRAGRAPTPEVKAEAIEILIASLRTGSEEVRETAARQLHNLTGEDHGLDSAAWEAWWRANRERFDTQAR
jgi:hypothetical protein